MKQKGYKSNHSVKTTPPKTGAFLKKLRMEKKRINKRPTIKRGVIILTHTSNKRFSHNSIS